MTAIVGISNAASQKRRLQNWMAIAGVVVIAAILWSVGDR
jgi:hypothetical protein